MQKVGLEPEEVTQLSEAVLAKFSSLDDQTGLAKCSAFLDFAQSIGNLTSHAHLYLVLGALNFPKLDENMVMFAGLTPTQAAKPLNSSSKKVAKLLLSLAEKSLLDRDIYGAYKVADANLWFELAKAVVNFQENQ
jgi:hypothetical protein